MPLRGSQVGMCCVVSTTRIIGLIVYSLTNTETEIYLRQILVLSISVSYELFQQGTATVHTPSNTVTTVRNIFGRRIINRPLRSRLPSLMLCDLCVRKHKTFHRHRTTNLQKSSGAQCWQFLDKNYKYKRSNNMFTTYQACLRVAGGHLQRLF